MNLGDFFFFVNIKIYNINNCFKFYKYYYRYSLKFVCNVIFYNEFGNCDGFFGFVLSDGFDFFSVFDFSVVNV